MNIVKKRSASIWICSAILIFAAANTLNFSDMAYGNGNPQSLIVTLCYIAFWVALLKFGVLNKKVLTFSIIAATISFAAAILGFITYMTEFAFGGAVFFAIPFLTPFFGGMAIVHKLVYAYPLMIGITAVWVGVSIAVRNNPARNVV
jgi:hypothetical protein